MNEFFTKTIKNGCQICGEDAHVLFRRQGEGLPGLKQKAKGTAPGLVDS